MAVRFPLKDRIVWSILLPVVVVGLVFAFLATHYLTPPLTSLIKDRMEADLRLASEMAMAICESNFNDLLELRLENDQEMNDTVKKEAIAEINKISKKLPKLHMLIIKDGRNLLGSSLDLPPKELRLPPLKKATGHLTIPDFLGQPARIYYQYFPFWRWHVASLIYEKDFLAPILFARKMIYLGTFSILLILVLTVFLVFNWRVNKPLKQIIGATEVIGQGEFKQLKVNRRDEIGRLSLAFNSMVEGLAAGQDKIRSILAELRESEEQYRLLTENSLALIFMIEEGRFIYVNKRAVENYGYTLEELLGIEVVEIIHPDDWNFFQQRMSSLERGEASVVHDEFRCRAKGGEIKWLEILAVPINYQGRQIILGHALDISDKKAANLEKAKLEAKLNQTQKLEAVATLAGGIAHDFNNILTAILGNISLALLDPRLAAQSRERLALSEKACQRAHALAQQLLIFGRGSEPIKKIISLKPLLTESANFNLSGSKTRSKILVPGDLWPVRVDPAQIDQVLSNLLINADQAMPEGGTIEISAENAMVGEKTGLPLSPGKYVKLAVADQGIGIAPKYLDKIFDPYFTTKHKGSGLGLAVAYSIIKNNAGYLSVESEVGNGATFQIYLPAAEAGDPVQEEEITTFPKGQGRILIMDDEEIVREVLSKMIDHLGYEVECVTNGVEAITRFSEAQKACRPFDAVLLDLTIPGGMGGQETLENLLLIDPQAKAVVSSGYSDNPVMADYRKTGFSGVIAKPYKVSELGRVLNAVIRGGPSG